MTLALVPTARLSELERVIERGRPAFIEVGLALAEIRDSKLYRVGYATFEAYCRERWEMSRPRAYQLIAAAGMSTTVDKPPTNERQARALLSNGHTAPPAYVALVEVMKAIEDLAENHGVDDLAASIPVKSQERYVRRLRRAGTFLGHIAYTIEQGEDNGRS